MVVVVVVVVAPTLQSGFSIAEEEAEHKLLGHFHVLKILAFVCSVFAKRIVLGLNKYPSVIILLTHSELLSIVPYSALTCTPTLMIYKRCAGCELNVP